MGLDAGSINADSGMSQAIYQALEAELAPPLLKKIREATDPKVKQALEEALAQARKGWKQLAYCIASGVVAHIKSSMEIFGIQSAGTLPDGSRFVAGQTGATTGHVK